MKKIFSFIVGLVAVASLQAVNYKDAARITMSCAGGSETQLLDLIVDADQATPATEPNLASLYEVGQVNLYANYNNGNISSFTANAIRNLPVVIVTNRRDVSYTFTFNVPVSTQGLVLTDLRSSEGVKNITMTNGDSYTFSVASEAAYAANTNVTIADRFVINYLPVSIKGTGDWWGLGKDVDLAISADLQTATGSLTFDAAGTYNFKVVRGSDWLSDVTEFTRNENERAITATEDGGMWFTIDAIGASNEYAFTWTFATNTLTIDFPAAPAPTCTTVRNNLVVDHYYTICLAQDVVSANGASFWNLSKRGTNVAYLEEAELPLEAGRPYIFQAEAEELCVVYGNAVPATEAGTAGALVGTFALMNQAALNAAATAANSDIYLLHSNELWKVNSQEDNLLPANRAYVVYSELIPENPQPAPGRRVRAIPMQPNVATGIDAINANEAPAKMIIDGKMVIIRGEHMFDATGRMVK